MQRSQVAAAVPRSSSGTLNEQHKEPAARAATALPAKMIVLISLLVTFNDFMRHNVKDLQQQQHAPGRCIQHNLHHQQQHRGLGSDSGDLMGLSMQQSEPFWPPWGESEVQVTDRASNLDVESDNDSSDPTAHHCETVPLKDGVKGVDVRSEGNKSSQPEG